MGRETFHSQPGFMSPSVFQGFGRIWALSLVNLLLIALLGGMMLVFADRPEFIYLTLMMIVSAAIMVVLLLFKLQRLKVTSEKQEIEAQAYEALPISLVVLNPDLHFCMGNPHSREQCWWAESIPFLKKVLSGDKDQEALERLIDGLKQQEARAETLNLVGRNGHEVWRIQAFPFGRQSLWKCANITQKKEEEKAQLKRDDLFSLFLDYAEDGLFSIDEKGILLFCNEKFATWLGYEKKDILGTSLSKILVKPKGFEPVKLCDIKGKCDFIAANSRIKTAFLEQTVIRTKEGSITRSLVNIHTPFANQEDMNKVLEMTPLPVICLDEHGVIQDSNILFRESFTQNSQQIRGTPFTDLVVPTKREDIQANISEFIKGTLEGDSLEVYFNDSRESIASCYFASLPVKNQKGCFILFHDITEQKRFETQLVQSQKMQAVGQLAGGIAHDFNNLLTAMIGFCDLMLLRHSPGDQSFTDIMQIKQNANRAANLVRQLLAFSRQQTLQPKVLDITECLAELSALLRRLIGSNIELNIKHARELGLVLVDQGQFEQVIINMVVNARDAMTSGGTISLSTSNCELKKAKRFGHDVIPPGFYVLVEISDTGSGIKPDIIDRIFDPFFSTKEVGSGTGLGLSTVYGIVKQTGGFIHVDSTVGKGTTFSIYLPQYTEEQTLSPSKQDSEKLPPQDLTGSSTILLVEDEDAVRLFSARALRSKGYHVIEAMDGEEALNYIKSSDEHIDLIISDVVMPQMDGPTFVNEITKLNKTPKVLFISGYTEETFQNRLKDDRNIQFLAKPFSLNDLAVRVKEILVGDSSSLKNVSNA